MRRREFITLVGGAASTWPFAASAQAPLRRPLIGFLAAGSKPETEQYYSGFLQGMHEFGYVDDRAYAVEVRYADGDSNRLLELAQELLHREPDVIVADSTPGTLAAKHATASVPIVGINMTNPVGLGLVESEARIEPATSTPCRLYIQLFVQSTGWQRRPRPTVQSAPAAAAGAPSWSNAPSPQARHVHSPSE